MGKRVSGEGGGVRGRDAGCSIASPPPTEADPSFATPGNDIASCDRVVYRANDGAGRGVVVDGEQSVGEPERRGGWISAEPVDGGEGVVVDSWV